MILLLGGTSETAPLATALAEAGYDVLVSTATEVALDVGRHPRIRRRMGRLDVQAMIALARQEHIQVVVDAAHPYATAAHTTADEAARALGIPCLTFLRPAGLVVQASGLHAAVACAATHDEAARLACAAGGPILLTTGSRNLAPYVSEAQRRGLTLVARVLPEGESLAACRAAGIPDERIVAARGPFSIEDNRAVIRKFGIRTLVTKDSGDAGGCPEKIEAARLEHCRVILVRRPPARAREAFASIPELVEALKGRTDQAQL
ncbi:MAG: precorrin-6A reductase [Planctomycetota bacterium]|nr:precorrin-6A reductase [Planctomycetota bacterium]